MPGSGVSIRLLPTCKSCLPFLLLDVSHHLSLSAQHHRQQKSIITRRNCEDLPLASPLASRTPSPLPVVSTPSLCASTNPPDSRGSRPRDFPVPLNPPLPGNLQNSTTHRASIPTSTSLPFERAHSSLCTAPSCTSAVGPSFTRSHTSSCYHAGVVSTYHDPATAKGALHALQDIRCRTAALLHLRSISRTGPLLAASRVRCRPPHPLN